MSPLRSHILFIMQNFVIQPKNPTIYWIDPDPYNWNCNKLSIIVKGFR